MNTRTIPAGEDSPVHPMDMEKEARQAKGKIASAAETVKDTAASVASDVKDRAAGVMEQARDSAMNKAGEARAAAVDVGQRLSDTLREAADRQPQDSFSARALTLMAGGLSDMAQKVDSTNLSQAMSDARDLARRHPVATATVAAAVGFALMRLIRAVPASRATAGHDRPEF